MNGIPDTLSIIDVETTGLSPKRDRVIEIAILRIEKGKIKETFETLINPEMSIPQEITILTGINARDLEKAPRFFDIKDEVKKLLCDSVFVAHNVQFDYGFIKYEFVRYGENINLKRLDTVRLFRSLYPEAQKFSLDRMIEFFGMNPNMRHRAGDDARVLLNFIKIIQKQHKNILSKHINIAMKRPSLPKNISEKDIDDLPESPGVYIFYGDGQTPLYIGKSTNIKDRVKSHFSVSSSVPKEFKIAQQINRVDYRTTSGELSALLLEATLIKKLSPLYNRKLRRLLKVTAIYTNEKPREYNSLKYIETDNIDPLTIGSLVGIFRSKKQASDKIMEIAKNNSLCLKLLELENGRGACFWHSLGWCRGACIKNESVARYNMRFVEAFSKFKFKNWPFPGPIMINEKSDMTNGNILIDKWCILRDATWDDEGSIKINETDYIFDLDSYKILVRFLLDSKNLHLIKPFNRQLAGNKLITDD